MTDEDARNEERLVGSYRLRVFRDIADDGEVREPLGSDPVGFILYSPERWMTALLMAAGRPNFGAGDILAGSDEERVAAFATASGYAGRWEIVGGLVVHHLEAATFPNWVDSVQKRPFEIEGDDLRLYPPPLLMSGKLRRSEVFWERIRRPAPR